MTGPWAGAESLQNSIHSPQGAKEKNTSCNDYVCGWVWRKRESQRVITAHMVVKMLQSLKYTYLFFSMSLSLQLPSSKNKTIQKTCSRDEHSILIDAKLA